MHILKKGFKTKRDQRKQSIFIHLFTNMGMFSTFSTTRKAPQARKTLFFKIFQIFRR